jgi:hypothetical protein
MTDDEIFHMFFEAAENFPLEHQKAAEDWLFKASAALQIVHELEAKGLTAFLTDD